MMPNVAVNPERVLRAIGLNGLLGASSLEMSSRWSELQQKETEELPDLDPLCRSP